MKGITLRNQNEIKSLQDNKSRPQSISEVIQNRLIHESLKDKGITRFKEIKDINQISFGHFIVLEKILALDKLSLEEKVAMMSPILLRPLNELKLDNENKERESSHKEMVYDEPIGNIYGAFNRYLELRHTYLYKTYNGVIYETLDEDEDDEDEKEEGTNINSGQSARQFHHKKFFWNGLISQVANGDIFKFSQAVDLMMYVVMPFLAEKRSLQIVEYLEHKASTI